MIALNGFIFILFPPIAVMCILGLLCLWKNRLTTHDNVFLFIVIFFLIIMLWRLFLVSDRRYMLPIVVPAIIFSVFFLKNLFNHRRRFKKWLCIMIVIIIALTGCLKAMRFQDSKPFLAEISTVIRKEATENNWETVYVLTLGNTGGFFDFASNVKLNRVSNDYDFMYSGHMEKIFKEIAVLKDDILLQYPVLYIIVSANASKNKFAECWNKKYNDKLELRYEYTQYKGKKCYQVFRVVSPYTSAHISKEKRKTMYKVFNLLPNPDFIQKKEILADSSDFEELSIRGIKIEQIDGRFYLPNDWNVNTWWIKSAPMTNIRYTDRGKLWLYCKNIIAFLQAEKPYSGGKKYQIYGRLKVNEDSFFFIDTLQTQNGQHCYSSRVVSLRLTPGEHEFCSIIDLTAWSGEGHLQIGMAFGDIEIESLYLTDQAIFNSADID